MTQITGQTPAESLISVSDAADFLGLTIAQTDDLLRRNLIESRTLVLADSVTTYRESQR